MHCASGVAALERVLSGGALHRYCLERLTLLTRDVTARTRPDRGCRVLTQARMVEGRDRRNLGVNQDGRFLTLRPPPLSAAPPAPLPPNPLEPPSPAAPPVPSTIRVPTNVVSRWRKEGRRWWIHDRHTEGSASRARRTKRLDFLPYGSQVEVRVLGVGGFASGEEPKRNEFCRCNSK